MTKKCFYFLKDVKRIERDGNDRNKKNSFFFHAKVSFTMDDPLTYVPSNFEKAPQKAEKDAN